MKLTKYSVAIVAMLCLSSAAQAQRSQGHILRVGETLASGNWLTSQNGLYELHMQQADGNLVLYRQGDDPSRKRWNPAGWNSGPKGGGAYVRVLEDGRLVMWRGTNWAWEWGKSGAWDANYRLVLGPDGSLKIIGSNGWPVLYRFDTCDAGRKTWAKHLTCGPNESPSFRDVTGFVSADCGDDASTIASRNNMKLCFQTPSDSQ